MAPETGIRPRRRSAGGLEAEVLDRLACPSCGGRLARTVEGDTIGCGACGRSFARRGRLFDLLLDRDAHTKLEDIDYDKVGGITDQVIDRIGETWLAALSNAGIDPSGKVVLEIGTGTGALTIGLLRKAAPRCIVATDVSETFLATALHRSGEDAPIVAVRCDCNAMPIRDGTFDVVLGRSILHHLLDFDRVLAQCARILKPGGKALFFEPVLEGKLVIAHFAALVAETARAIGDTDFDEDDHRRLRTTWRNITKESWYPQDRESLGRIEDKFIFRVERMRKAGLAAGFDKVTLVRDDREIDPTYWAYFVHNMRVAGIAAPKLHKYKFLAKAFEASFGAFPEALTEPMNYFCFSKAPTARRRSGPRSRGATASDHRPPSPPAA